MSKYIIKYNIDKNTYYLYSYFKYCKEIDTEKNIKNKSLKNSFFFKILFKINFKYLTDNNSNFVNINFDSA